MTLTSDLVVLEKSCPENISYIFKGGIPNVVCGCAFGWQSVTYHFLVTLTLTSDLVCRIIVYITYFLYQLRWEFKLCCMDTSLDADASHTILRSL